MKFHVKKITSVTLLASMMLSVVSPSALSVMAYENETGMSEMAVVETDVATEAMMAAEPESQTAKEKETAESAAQSEEVTEQEKETAAVREQQTESEQEETVTAEETRVPETKPDETNESRQKRKPWGIQRRSRSQKADPIVQRKAERQNRRRWNLRWRF